MFYKDGRNELRHFGILGQKWGIRKYQNKDGTLTDAGKARYYSKKEFDDDAQKLSENSKTEIANLQNKGQKLVDAADSLYESYGKAFDNMVFSDDDKKKIWKKIHDEYDGVKPNNKSDFDYTLEELVANQMNQRVPKDVINQRKQFDALQDEYWNDAHRIAKPLEDKYKDTLIVDVQLSMSGQKKVTDPSSSAINRFYGSVLDTSFPAYISRHFDDYWVRDTDKYVNAISRLSKDFKYSDFDNHSRSKNTMAADRRAVNRYRDEHPGTELTDYQILEALDR